MVLDHSGPAGDCAGTEFDSVSLVALRDLLEVLEPELSTLPGLVPLFAGELEAALAEVLRASGVYCE